MSERTTMPPEPRDPAPLEEIDRIRAAANGDRAAFAGLYALHGPAVARRLSHLMGPRGGIDDLVQETFLRALTALPRFRHHSPFRHWILRIATSVAFDEQRRSRRSLWRLFALPEQLEETVDGRAGADRTLELSAVHAALRRLSPKLREVVVLFELEGMSLQEIATEMKVPLHTVASRLRRGREGLRAVLARGSHDAAIPVALLGAGERG